MSVHVSSKPADEASRLPVAAWLVLGSVLVAEVMDLLDSAITTIAAPAISSSLHGGPGLIKWLGASYALALGVLLVTGGRLGDKYGRRRTFLIGIAGFTAAPRPVAPANSSVTNILPAPRCPERSTRDKDKNVTLGIALSVKGVSAETLFDRSGATTLASATRPARLATA
jgi:MFS family permease